MESQITLCFRSAIQKETILSKYFTRKGEHNQEKRSNERNKRNIMFQSALRVSCTSPTVMHWITQLLIWLSEDNYANTLGDDLSVFSGAIEEIAKNAVREQFVLDFNSKTFMPVDFAYENGIVLNTYENDGTATFSILEHTFNNIQTFNQFIGLSKELATTNSNEISYIQNLNQWICNNVQYDNAGVSNNLSTDIFSGTSRAEGISNAVQILCNLYGIGCEIETGTVNGMPATWNKLYINSEPYYLDCTLNIYYQNPDAYTLSNELWDDHLQ